jgi:hypothetical protein
MPTAGSDHKEYHQPQAPIAALHAALSDKKTLLTSQVLVRYAIAQVMH